MTKKPEIRTSSKADQFDESNELWESKQLGASSEHAEAVSDEREKELDESLGLRLLTFRIQQSLVDQLKQLAKLEGIGYQPFMRQVLTRYVRENEHKLQSLLTPQQASDKAEELFMEAVEYRKTIPKLEPMSTALFKLEHTYSRALQEANTLFLQAYEKCADPVLKKQIKHRTDQISAFLDDDLQNIHDQKYSKNA